MEDMRVYVNVQWPHTILEVIHHSCIAYKLFLSLQKIGIKGGEKGPCKMVWERHEKKDSRIIKKEKDKGSYEGKRHYTPEEMEQLQKEG